MYQSYTISMSPTCLLCSSIHNFCKSKSVVSVHCFNIKKKKKVPTFPLKSQQHVGSPQYNIPVSCPLGRYLMPIAQAHEEMHTHEGDYRFWPFPEKQKKKKLKTIFCQSVNEIEFKEQSLFIEWK